jgi:hypothetical protein
MDDGCKGICLVLLLSTALLLTKLLSLPQMSEQPLMPMMSA